LLAAGEGFRRWASWHGRWPRRGPGLRAVIGAVVAAPLLLAGVASARYMLDDGPVKADYFRPHPLARQLAELRRLIPDGASLATTNRLGVYFAARRDYYLSVSLTCDRAINRELRVPLRRDTDFQLFDLSDLRGTEGTEARIVELLADPRYGLRYADPPVLLFQRGWPHAQHPEVLRLFTSPVAAAGTAAGSTRVFAASLLARNPEACFAASPEPWRRELRFRERCPAVLFGPYTGLDPGGYEVRFFFEPPASPGAFAAIDVSAGQTLAQAIVSEASLQGPPGQRYVPLRIAVTDKTSDLEFRTHGPGLASFALDRVEVIGPAGDGNARELP
jgi:hypothetical protein